MSKMKRFAAMSAALLISASTTMGYMPQDSIKISNVTANAADEITSVEINETNFPDAIFREYVKKAFDKDGDGVLSAEEITALTAIEVNSMGISDLTGIEHFTSLETLWCYANKLTTIDVSNNTALTGLFCDFNQLTSIDVSKNTELFSFTCEGNQLTSLDVSNNPTLRSLYCLNNQLTSLDLSNNTNLGYLYCGKNQLTSLDVSKNTALIELYCDQIQLTSLDVSNNTALKRLCCYANKLTAIDVSNNPKLTTLYCYNNQLTSLDLSNNTALEILKADDNKFIIALTDNTFDLSTLPTGFDVSKASEWTNATVKGNILTVEDITKEVTYKYGCGNKIAKKFTLIPQIAETPVETTAPKTTTTATTTITAPKATATTTTTTAKEEITGLEINETNFPDSIFRQYVAEEFDLNCNSELSDKEIAYVTEIYIDKSGISDLTGIEYFENLAILYCSFNNLTTLDLSDCTALNKLSCEYNQLTSLDVSNCSALTNLSCYDNQLTSLDVSNNTALTYFSCDDNQLTSLDLSNNSALSSLQCRYNNLTSLDVSNNPELRFFTCYGNQLTSLDVSKNTALTNLGCHDNQLTSLDVSNNTALDFLNCSGNQLTSLDLSNNTALTDLNTYRNEYEITLTGKTFDLSTLPTGFDVTKASDWTNGTVKGNILTVDDTSKVIVYKYDLGNGNSETFILIPQVEETPVKTTTAPKTTATTTTTTPETITTTTTTANIESDSTTNTTTSTTYTPAATSTTAKPIPTPIETYGTCGAQGSNVTWTYDGNGTLTISGEGKMTNWSSNESPWFNKQEIETIIIEDGITNIGSFAFRYCHSLTSITIPESVTSIGYGAFNFCDSLASITIPESVTDITPGAFSGSKWFKTQQEKNLFVIVNGILIDGTACKGDVVIPDSVKTINEEAFERCYDLTEITIPESVTSIGKDAFNHCDSLNKITIKNPDCEIYDAAETICDGYYFSLFYYFTGKIYGYKNSTAQAYAEKYNIRFVAIDETPAETTTTATTTAPEITTTTTTTTAEEEEITSVEINETNFPDYLLRYYITKYIDTDTDNILSAEEIADVTKLNISVGGIRELTGIHYFKNLEDLDCYGNKLTTIDISNFTALTRLNCGKNKLTSLDISNCTALNKLYCEYNQLTSLDLSNNTALAYLSCYDNQLTSLDLSNNTALAYLYCYDNQLTSLDLSNNTALTKLDCGKNQLTSLDVSSNTALTRLECYYNQLTSLDVSNNTALIRLVCYENQLTSLDVSNCSALTYLGCSNNQLTSLDVSNTKMQSTSAFQNEYEIALIGNTFDLSTLPTGFDVSKASNWTNATVKGNILTVEDTSKSITYKYDCGNGNSEKFTLIPQIEETPAETTTTAPKTTTTTTTPETITTTTTIPKYSYSLHVYPYNEEDTIYEIGEELDYSTICVHGYGGGGGFHADIPYISLANCGSFVTVDASEFDNTKPGTYTIYVKWETAVDSFDVTVVDSDNAETPITGVEINETNFPDSIFRQYIAEKYDDDNDGTLSYDEMINVTQLLLRESGVSDLTGLQYFKNLAILDCAENNLTQLDISENTALTHLYCSDNNLTNLDISNNVILNTLSCYNNKLTKLDLSSNSELGGVWCSNNQLTSLDVSHNTLLTDLLCSNNQLASVDLSNTICIKNGEWGTVLNGNKHKIALTNNTFDLSTLPAGFDVSKASDWTNATVEGNILTIEDITKEVTYTYDCGLGFSDTFTLVPQIAETPAETTTTTAAPETTITTTATTTVTTTPATTTPEDDLPQTGFSNLYNCIPVSAGAMLLLGMYAVKKSRKEDEE